MEAPQQPAYNVSSYNVSSAFDQQKSRDYHVAKFFTLGQEASSFQFEAPSFMCRDVEGKREEPIDYKAENARNSRLTNSKRKFLVKDELKSEEVDPMKARAWHLESGGTSTPQRKFIGTYEGGQNSSYVLFLMTEGGFTVIPCDDWFNFKSLPSNAHRPKLDLTQAEARMQAHQNIGGAFVAKHRKEAADAAAASSGLRGLNSDFDAFDDADQGIGKREKTEEKGESFEYSEFFSDDDEALAPDENTDTKESSAPPVPAADLDEMPENDEELGDSAVGDALTDAGKEMNGLLKRFAKEEKQAEDEELPAAPAAGAGAAPGSATPPNAGSAASPWSTWSPTSSSSSSDVKAKQLGGTKMAEKRKSSALSGVPGAGATLMKKAKVEGSAHVPEALTVEEVRLVLESARQRNKRLSTTDLTAEFKHLLGSLENKKLFSAVVAQAAVIRQDDASSEKYLAPS